MTEESKESSANAKRPSARRGAAQVKPAVASELVAAELTAPKRATAKKRASVKSMGASALTGDGGVERAPSASVVPQSAHGSPAHDELFTMNQSIDALLTKVDHADADVDARQQAADAIGQIASRLDPGTPDVRELESDTLLQNAKQFLSTDYYLRQWGRMAMRNRSETVDDFGLDATYDARVQPVFDTLFDKYFRVQVEGIENIPADGRAILVGNHSGTLPWDGVMLKTAIRKLHPAARELRWLAEDYVYHSPFMGAFLNRVGAVRACPENAERLLAHEKLVAVFPEGIKGIGKTYGNRYQLQRFGRGGYVKLALRTQSPIIPVAIIGGEETYPLLYKLGGLSKLLGVPFVPITPTFPWLGPLGLVPLPSRWRIAFGAPVEGLERHSAADADNSVLINELNERVRTLVQRLVDEQRTARGNNAFA
jgi:1-acyl-sn-glycerol-3-phosphate acyltransferase